MDILQWLKNILDKFLVSTAQNSFTGSEYYYENGIDYSGEIESESDCN